MKNLLSKFKVKKTEYPKGYELPLEYIVIFHDPNGYNLKSELMNKYDLEQMVLKNRDRIKYIFKYEDRFVISNEVIEIKEDLPNESND